MTAAAEALPREPTAEEVREYVRFHKYCMEVDGQKEVMAEEAAADWLQYHARKNLPDSHHYAICPTCGDFYRQAVTRGRKLTSLGIYAKGVDTLRTGLVIEHRHCDDCIDEITGKSKNYAAVTPLAAD